jgi:hypothetical protein
MATNGKINVDTLWAGLRQTTVGLQAAGRLPTDGELYDSSLKVVRDFLTAAAVARALEEASRLKRANPGAAYLAYELLTEYTLAAGQRLLARETAREASRLLAQCAKAEAKRRKKRRY